MATNFDPDALLDALPRRTISPFRAEVSVRLARRVAAPLVSALFEKGAYNGFSDRERYRTAELSKWLAEVGSAERPSACDICGGTASDEHAENYYDLTSWVGLCRRCHRTLLHGRFARRERWLALLDQYQLPDQHWSRLVSSEPFDLASLQRSRGWREPTKADFAAVRGR